MACGRGSLASGILCLAILAYLPFGLSKRESAVRTRFRGEAPARRPSRVHVVEALFPLAALLAGIAHACGYASGIHGVAEALLDEAPAQLEVTLLEDCAESTFLPRAACRVVREGGFPVTIVVEFEEGELALCSQRLSIEGRLRLCSESSREYCWQKGTLLVFKARHVEELQGGGPLGAACGFREAAVDAIGSEDDAHALVQALACGYRANLSTTKLYARFQTAGLAHLVAVSGAHLVIVTGLISWVLKALRMPRKPMVVLLILYMCAYTVMAGMPVSCIRAATMSSVGILALLGRRRPSSLNALGMTVFVIIAAAPHAAVSASFTLSALATMGIVLFAPLFELALENLMEARWEALRQSLALTASAGMLAQWYACALFKIIPLVAPLANAICAPIFPACCSLGLLAAVSSACGLAPAPLLVDAAAALASALALIVTALSSLPHAAAPISLDTLGALAVSAACGTAVWIAWERLFEREFIAAAAAICAALAAGLTIAIPEDAIVMLDVGQGDAFLVTSKGRSILVDTGNQDRKLLDQLARCRVSHIDVVVITHADDDHCGSLDALEKAVDVDVVALAEGLLVSDDAACRDLVEQAHATARSVNGLSVGDVQHVGRFAAHVIWPEEVKDAGGNADSVVLRVEYDADGDGLPELTSLFTGDAEKEQLGELISKGAVGDVDLLKVGHHGSRNAFEMAQLETLDPEIALIGVGENNRYGHPTQEILDMLDDVGCTVFRSDRDGGVKLRLDGRSISVRHL